MARLNYFCYILSLCACCLFFVAIFCACDNHSNCKKMLTQAELDAAMQFPDSAISIYEHTAECPPSHRECNERRNILRIIKNFNVHNKQDNDSLSMSVREYYSQSDNKNLKAISQLCCALVYAELGEDSKAVKAYSEAANTGKSINNNAMKYILYSQWGWLLRSESPYTESIEKYKCAKKYALAMNDYAKAIHMIDLIGWEYVYSQDYGKALSVFSDALIMAKRHNYDRKDLLLKSIAAVYEMQGKHSHALEYVDKAIRCVKTGNDVKPLFAIKGVVLMNLGQYDSAYIYINKGRQSKEFYQKASYFNDMSELESQRGNYKLALEYKTLFSTEMDSMYNYQRNEEIMKVQKLYNYSLLAAERNKLALESERRGNFIALLIAVVFVILTFIGYAYQRWRRRINRAIQTKERLLAKSLSQIKEHNYLLMKTKQEAQDKEIELMRTLNDKNLQLAELRQQQQDLKLRIFRMDEVIKKIERVRDMQERKKITLANKIALSEEERENLVESTNLCYDYFVDRLKKCFPELSLDDLCLCCLLKININTQDQCLLLSTSDSTLRKRKYRLKNKKMMLGSRYETLDEFIITF